MIRYVVIGVIIAVVLLLSLFFAIANFSGENYFKNLEKTQRIRNSYGVTTYEFVEEINKKHFANKLKLARCRQYDDHYSNGIVALSEQTMQSNSLSSLATIAHEVGHARQDFRGVKLQKLYRLRRIGRVFSIFVLPFLLSGAILCALSVFGVIENQVLLYVGFGLVGLGFFNFFFVIYEKYKEIQIEKEASTFALVYLREYLLEEEVSICKEFLDSARLTYWSDLFKALLSWTFLTKRSKKLH